MLPRKVLIIKLFSLIFWASQSYYFFLAWLVCGWQSRDGGNVHQLVDSGANSGTDAVDSLQSHYNNRHGTVNWSSNFSVIPNNIITKKFDACVLTSQIHHAETGGWRKWRFQFFNAGWWNCTSLKFDLNLATMRFYI